MKKMEKLYKKLRLAEQEALIASPPRAAKLAKKIVKWKAEVFDKR